MKQIKLTSCIHIVVHTHTHTPVHIHNDSQKDKKQHNKSISIKSKKVHTVISLLHISMTHIIKHKNE